PLVLDDPQACRTAAAYCAAGDEGVPTVEGASPVEVLKAHHATDLVLFEVTWFTDTEVVDGGGALAGVAPQAAPKHYRLDGDGVDLVATWTSRGAIAPYDIGSPGKEPEWVSLPAVALQAAVEQAVLPLPPGLWRDGNDVLTVPVVIAADEEYRAAHGDTWAAD